MNRRKAILLFGAAHLLVISGLVTLVGLCLYGSASTAYAGWSGGFIVAVWTLPLSAFAGHFLGTRTTAPAHRKRSTPSRQRMGTEKAALRE